MSRLPKRWRCTECHDICDDADMLRAPDPFTTDGTVTACPTCREVETLEGVCDVKGCKRVGHVATPTPQGYRWTCHEHAPEATT